MSGQIDYNLIDMTKYDPALHALHAPHQTLKSERIPIGSLVTWGSGFGLGLIVGSCNSNLNYIYTLNYTLKQEDLGIDPSSLSFDSDYDAYVILTTPPSLSGSSYEPKEGMGQTKFIIRLFDDKNFSNFINNKPDVRKIYSEPNEGDFSFSMSSSSGE